MAEKKAGMSYMVAGERECVGSEGGKAPYKTIRSHENSLTITRTAWGNHPHNPVTISSSLPQHLEITIQDETWVGTQSLTISEVDLAAFYSLNVTWGNGVKKVEKTCLRPHSMNEWQHWAKSLGLDKPPLSPPPEHTKISQVW